MGITVIEAFTGTDRRKSSEAASTPTWPRHLAWPCGVALVVVACVPASATWMSLKDDGWQFAALSAVVGLVALVSWIGVWVVSGLAWPVYVGAAVAPVWALAAVASTPDESVTRRPMWSFAALLVAAAPAAFLSRARRSPEVDASLRPHKLLALTLANTGVVLGGIAVVAYATTAASEIMVLALGASAVTLWCLGTLSCRRALYLPYAARVPMTWALLAFALSCCDGTVGRLDPAGRLGPWAFACCRLLSLVGWCLVLAVAVMSLRSTWATATTRQGRLRSLRDDAVGAFVSQSRALQEERHDLRSLIAGIQCATMTLVRYRDRVGEAECRSLESALLCEVSRLQRVLAAREPDGMFDVAAAVRPVIAAERAQGAVIEADLTDVVVHGDGDAVAEVLQNLLVNTRRHAPGATIAVSVRAIDDHSARLVVADDGPGLPEPVRRRFEAALTVESATQRTRRLEDTATSNVSVALESGHGLGLDICARIAHEQGIRLRLLESATGTQIELVLARVADIQGAYLLSDASALAAPDPAVSL